MSMRVLCIWLPNWPSQRAAVAISQADPNLANKPIGPIILHARDPRRGRVVAAANATAREKGVLPHMPLSQASTLCPLAQLIEHDAQADIEALCSIAEMAQCFSPIVGIEQLDTQPWAGRSLHQPQAIMLDITGIGKLFGGESQLATAVNQWCIDQGYLASIAIAGSVGTAWALANYSYRANIAAALIQLETTRDLSNIAKFVLVLESAKHFADSDNIQDDGRGDGSELRAGRDNGPILQPTGRDNGSILQPTGRDNGSILLLPIEALRLEQATVTKLHRLGIRKIGQLLELPRAGLASRFNDQLLARIDQTLHQRHEPIVSLHPTPELAIEETLEHPTPVRETIDSILAMQIASLCRTLDRMGHGALRLVCRLEMERNAIPIESDEEHRSDQPSRVARVFQLGLYQPSTDANHLLWLLRGQLDAQFSKGPSNFWVRAINSQCTLTAPISWQQSDLFDRHTVVHRDAIAKLVDNLSARMGRNAVVTPSLHRDPQPELAYSWRALTGWRNDGAQQDTKRKLSRAPKRNFAEQQSPEPNAGELWRRPMRFIQPPKPIEVSKLDTTGAPATVLYQGTQQSVQQSIGPERIDSGWWNGSTQQRDYYRAELSTGPWIWLYKNRRDQTWYLNGEFD